MAGKKTLYDLLDVSPDASFSGLEAAYLRATQKLESDTSGLTAESKDVQSKVLKMAYQTLSNDKSRQAYDSRLNLRAGFAVAPPLAPPETLSLQAAAVSLKADAASLMAEAAVLKADAVSLQVETTPKKLAALVAKGVRATFTALGAVVTVVFALLFGLFWAASGTRQAAQEEEKAREKVMIQDYYQQHGVRPKSKVELELLEAESHRAAKAEGEAALEKQKVQRKELEYQRFVEDSRRLGEQVSENLRREQERAEREARYAAEKARQELRMKEEAERARIENERRRLGLQ
jgi:curved DNA-binding protein CbpA